MAKKKKYSTNTITDDNKITPFLSSSGELAYTPENPPDRDYFFQYGWILPKIISDSKWKKCHHYFGNPIKSDSDFLFDFWHKARKGDVDKIALIYGQKLKNSLIAPIAVYQHKHLYKEGDYYLLIQHGSYQQISKKEQPLIDQGMLIIYRGIGKSKEFNYLKYDLPLNGKKESDVLDKYFDIQMSAFADSELSFSIAHNYVIRVETDFLTKENVTWDDIANSKQFDWNKDKFMNNLRVAYRQSYSLDCYMATQKFGPNYVKCLTPISNVRITTFFAGENEVNIIDPSIIEILSTIGCKNEVINPYD